ncbi:MAG TPA: hypothetical protein VGD77_02355 [Gemmatimonadaceae bacterium]
MTTPERDAGSRDEGAFANPLRTDEHRAVRAELEQWLHERKIELNGSESDETLVAMVNAVEEYERCATAAGADLMVDTPESSDPDRPDLVLPRRGADERGDAYASRIRERAKQLGKA